MTKSEKNKQEKVITEDNEQKDKKETPEEKLKSTQDKLLRTIKTVPLNIIKR